MRETTIAIRSRDGGPKEAILLTIDFREHSGQWLAECLELGTATHADTLEEVRREILENVMLQLDGVEELGFMEEYLRQHSVQLLPLETTSASEAKAATWAVPTPVSV